MKRGLIATSKSILGKQPKVVYFAEICGETALIIKTSFGIKQY